MKKCQIDLIWAVEMINTFLPILRATEYIKKHKTKLVAHVLVTRSGISTDW